MKKGPILYSFIIAFTLFVYPSLSQATSNHDASLLLEAARNGKMDTVKAEIEKGADVNARDEEDNSVLMNAVIGGHVEVVKTLLEYRAGQSEAGWVFAGNSMEPLAKVKTELKNVFLWVQSYEYKEENPEIADELAQIILNHIQSNP